MSGNTDSGKATPSGSAITGGLSFMRERMGVGQEQSYLAATLSSKLPFEYDDAVGTTIPEVPEEAVMSDEDAKAALVRMYQEWGVTENSTKQLLFNAIIMYLVLNGASRRGEYKGDLIVKGVKYPSKIIYRVLRGDIRKFARVYADYAKQLLDDAPDFAAKRATAYGVDLKWASYCFDFADKCTDIDLVDAGVMATVKSALLRKSSPMVDVDPNIAASGSNGGGQHSVERHGGVTVAKVNDDY